MTQRVTRRGGATRQQRPALNAVAGAVLILAASSAAQAQDTQTITVTGIRAAIESAISTKKNASNIVESMNAEDIGKMPDATIADSVSRLPGVSLQRDRAGRAKSISVRGMSPDFNGTTLNGREMASTGDSRGVEFDQFPSELISGILIHKTPNASLVGQGLAATVDMQTVRPLDYRKRTLAVNARQLRTGVSTGGEEGTGDRQSFSYIDQFMDRKLGIAFGISKAKDAGASVSNGGGNAWGRWEQQIATPQGNVLAPAGFGEDVNQYKQSREGMMAVFQFKPSKDFETSLDLFRSKGSFGTKKTGIEGALACQPALNNSCGNFPYDPETTLDTTKPYEIVTVDGKQYLSSATLNGVKGVVRNHLEAGDDSLSAWGWNTKFKAVGWDFTTDLSRSKVKRESDRFETTAGVPGVSTAADLGSLTYSGFQAGSGVFERNVDLGGSVDYGSRDSVKLTDVNGWSGGEAFPQAGYNAHPTVTDTINNLRLTGRKDFSLGLITGVEAGINTTKREKVRVAPEGVLRILPGTDPYAGATVPGSGTTFLPTLGVNVVSFDPRGTVGSIYERVEKLDAAILNKDWNVTEKVNTGFVKGEIEGTLFGFPVVGNVGLQLVRTNQTSQGFNVDGAACADAANCTSGSFVLSSAEHSYTDVNPSLNLNFDIGNDQALRVGLAKVMARPNMADMRSSLTYTVNSSTGIVTGEAGNPNLEPFRAAAIDVSYEKYFGTKGYVAVAGFYKDLDSYIVRSNRVFDFSTYVAGNPAVTDPLGILSQPVNGKGGTISGVELSVNLPFSMVAKALDGFGIYASHSTTNSSVKLPSSGFRLDNLDGATIPLPGLSKNVTNLRVYYEKFGLQVSVGARSRSDFLGEISNFQDDRSLTYIKGDTVVDLQLGYEIQSGFFKGLSALFQGSNMTNSEFVRYRDKPSNTVETIKYGKTYLLGLNYKY